MVDFPPHFVKRPHNESKKTDKMVGAFTTPTNAVAKPTVGQHAPGKKKLFEGGVTIMHVSTTRDSEDDSMLVEASQRI